MDNTSFILNSACAVCRAGDKAPEADLGGGSSYINKKGFVSEFSVGDQILLGWNLTLYLHGRYSETAVIVVDVDLEGNGWLDNPQFLRIRFLHAPEFFKKDPAFKTILGVVPEYSEGVVDERAIIKKLVPGNFLAIGDSRGQGPRTPISVPLIHIHAAFVSFG